MGFRTCFFLLCVGQSFLVAELGAQPAPGNTSPPASAMAASANPGPSAAAPNGAPGKTLLPYLGPGADKLSPEEYVKTYKDYIREAIQYGFPPDRCQGNRCDQGLDFMFRTAGLYAYPLPAGSDVKAWRHPEGIRECYESGGTVAQVERQKNGTLKSAVVVHARTPKAITKIGRACREQTLELNKDPKTGLERVAGVPAGYPHPYLCVESQGIVLRKLNFNLSQASDCHPVDFADNAWERQLRLSEGSCTETQSDLKQAWGGKISPNEFANRERARRKARVQEVVSANGGSAKDVERMLTQYYSGPIDHDLTLVGGAMRNLEYCNQLGLVSPTGKVGKDSSTDGKPGADSLGGAGGKKAQ